MALVYKRVKDYNYTPLDERGEENPFSITFVPLSTRAMATLEDGYVTIKGEESISIHQGTYNYKAVKTALKKWENLTDDMGKPIKLKITSKNEVADESLDMLPSAVLSEIAAVIINVSKYPEGADTFLGTVSDDYKLAIEEEESNTPDEPNEDAPEESEDEK